MESLIYRDCFTISRKRDMNWGGGGGEGGSGGHGERGH